MAAMNAENRRTWEKQAVSGAIAPAAEAKKFLGEAARGRRLAVVLGSGFGSLLQSVKVERSWPYEALPGLRAPGAPGHTGRLLLATLEGEPAILFAGRLHYYEGCSWEQVVFPARWAAALGVEVLLLTCAAGGIHPELRPGVFMGLRDHINLMGDNPLRGALVGGGPCFLDLSRLYDAELRRKLRRAAEIERIPYREGVYAAVAGPAYETPAEILAFRALGADAVGMSVVPEAITARALGLRVAAVACVTNPAAGLAPGPLSHEEVLAAGRRAAEGARRFVRRFVRLFREDAAAQGSESNQ